MKKILLGIFAIALLTVFYLIYNDYSFSPLNEKDFQKLFIKYKAKGSKICSKDFLGVSSKGELFEIYLYKVDGAIIDINFPQITNWENREIISSSSFISKWKNCPLDSNSIALYKFTLTANDLNELECNKSFNQDLANSKNYYSYIYINELEQYFLLFCSDRKEVYYIRRKGF